MPRRGYGSYRDHPGGQHHRGQGHAHKSTTDGTRTTAISSTSMPTTEGSTAMSSATAGSSTVLTKEQSSVTHASSVEAAERQSLGKENEAPVPATLVVQQPADYVSWQVKGVLCLLFGFLIALLVALSYALFSFLTAPQTPTHGVSTATSESTSTESTTMFPEPPTIRTRVPTPRPPVRTPMTMSIPPMMSVTVPSPIMPSVPTGATGAPSSPSTQPTAAPPTAAPAPTPAPPATAAPSTVSPVTMGSTATVGSTASVATSIPTSVPTVAIPTSTGAITAPSSIPTSAPTMAMPTSTGTITAPSSLPTSAPTMAMPTSTGTITAPSSLPTSAPTMAIPTSTGAVTAPSSIPSSVPTVVIPTSTDAITAPTTNAASSTALMTNASTASASTAPAGRTPASSTRRPGATSGNPMGKAPLFCTYGVHQQNYDAISIDACDYAFVPFYVQGGDTFVDDSSAFTQKLIAKAVASTRTAYAISVAFGNYSAALSDVKSPMGRTKVEQYWTTKKIYHYAVFDIYFLPGGADPNAGLKGAFDLLKEFRTVQTDLKANNPGLQGAPERGFVVAGIYFHPINYRAVLRVFENELRNFKVDGLLPYTHLPVDEYQVGLNCSITGGAPFSVRDSVNLVGMEQIIRDISLRTALDKPSLAVTVSLCTRLYMPVRTPALDAPCASHMRRPNTTAAFCNDPMSLYSMPTIRRQDRVAVAISRGSPRLVTTFDTNETIAAKYCLIKEQYEDIGLALFEVECEDWSNMCTNQTMALAGTERFQKITTYFSSVANVSANDLTCS